MPIRTKIGKNEKPAAAHDRAKARQLVFRETAQTELARFEIDHDAHGNVKEDTRNRRDFDDFKVRDVGHLGHDERAGAHDGRHDHRPGGRRSFHRRRDVRRKAGRLHQRYGYRARW